MSSKKQLTRRKFLQTSGAAAAAAGVPYIFTGAPAVAAEAKAESKNDRPLLGCIGTGSRWGAVGGQAMRFSDCVAVCDVDGQHLERAKQRVQSAQGKAPEAHEDYRKVLDRKDIDLVTIVTPDHWHTKIAIEAMQAGKDVYCEKPLTLTIDEGKLINKVAKETGRIFQVGTQQRSEMGQKFLKAAAICRDGRLGKIQRVTCSIGGAPTSGPIPAVDPPKHLNWDFWLGQTPVVPYRKKGRHTNCHYEFRWWYAYSGGKMTDWGAHHVDIAHWALGKDDTGPISIDGWGKHPNDEGGYNTATQFNVKCKLEDGIELVIRHGPGNGLLIEGEKASIFVSRGTLKDEKGDVVKSLGDNPLPDKLIRELYNGRQPTSHMGNFFACVKAKGKPVSDVWSHHRAMTTCHLANICIRLGRGLKWDPVKEQIVGDEEANGWLSRKQREKYAIKV